ncbi:MAG: response regulator [Thermodesulfobacteriota bacterium]|nr:response regulator [Thermodesulfobacteriota bacterium]
MMTGDQRILFVDDDQRFLASLRRSLAKSFDLTFVDSPQEALEQLQEQKFSVVVSDMNMPGMSGVDLLSLVKSKYPETVRILFTGFADQQSAIDAINQGEIFRFLTKPCDLVKLEQILSDAVRQNQLINAERDGCQSVFSLETGSVVRYGNIIATTVQSGNKFAI